MRSERSTVRTCDLRAADASASACSAASAASRDRRMRSACSLF